jgi:hypothetical protein
MGVRLWFEPEMINIDSEVARNTRTGDGTGGRLPVEPLPAGDQPHTGLLPYIRTLSSRSSTTEITSVGPNRDLIDRDPPPAGRESMSRPPSTG